MRVLVAVRFREFVLRIVRKEPTKKEVCLDISCSTYTLTDIHTYMLRMLFNMQGRQSVSQLAMRYIAWFPKVANGKKSGKQKHKETENG